MKIKKITNKAVQLSIISLLTTFYTYRSTLKGYMFGDPFDARLQMVLHEHWYRFFTLQTSLRDTEFFYPYKQSLGFSDVFLVQGLVHSSFRFFGNSMQNSWVLTNLLLVLVGNLGWVALSTKFIKNRILSIFFVIATHISVAFYAHFTYQANTVGYTFISWLAVYIIYARNKISNDFHLINKYALYFLVIIIIYALSCWYVVFFLLLNLFFYFIVNLLIKNERNKLKIILSKCKKNFEINIWVKLSPLYLGLAFLFLYIYLPVQGAPDRPISEMIDGSPKLIDFMNSTRNEQAVFRYFYEFFNLTAEVERRMGLGIILPIISVIIILIIAKNWKLYIFELKIMISTFMTYLYFIVVFDNYSLHRLFFENVIGFNSIRYPFRYLIIMSFILLILIFKVIDQIKVSNKKKIPIYFFSLILVLDQFRFEWNGWNFSEYLNSDLESYAKEVKENCDYFYYDTPGGWWYDQIEAMTFAYQIGIPTVNGYSGGFPNQYPSKDFRDSSYTYEIFDWMKQIELNKNGCFLTGKSPIYYLNKNISRLDLVGIIEFRKDNYLATSPYPYFFIYSSEPGVFKVSFKISKLACQKDNDIFMRLLPETDSKKINIDSLELKQIDFMFTVDESRIRRLEISTDAKSCTEDKSEVYFKLQDIKLESVNQELNAS